MRLQCGARRRRAWGPKRRIWTRAGESSYSSSAGLRSASTGAGGTLLILEALGPQAAVIAARTSAAQKIRDGYRFSRDGCPSPGRVRKTVPVPVFPVAILGRLLAGEMAVESQGRKLSLAKVVEEGGRVPQEIDGGATAAQRGEFLARGEARRTRVAPCSD